jgi:tetratricopeptide (TPR) repeat protein
MIDEPAMPKTERRTGRDSTRWLFAGLVFIIGLTLYAATLPPSILPGDSGELIAASYTLSIAHPPGYPIYLMVGKLFSSAVVWGSVAHRYNLLSAVAAALTAAVFYLLLLELGARRLVSFGIALALAAHQSFWLYAVAAEVYTVNALFTVILLYIGAISRRYGERSFLLLAYVGGLAISHHLTLIYPVAGAAVLAVLSSKIVPRPRVVAGCVFLGLLGLTAWLYIPIRSSSGPPFTWGSTDTADGFLSHITASRYSWRLKTYGFTARLGEFLKFFRLIASEFGGLLVGLAGVGVAMAVRKLSKDISWAAGAGLMIVLYAVHFALYSIPDVQGHILPALIGIGLLAGMGVEKIVAEAGRASRALALLLAVAVFAIPVVSIARLSRRHDEWLAHDYALAIGESARAACGPRPVIITSTDLAGLSLAYLVYVEGFDAVFYMQGVSNPSVIGSTAPTRSIGEAIQVVSRNFGPSRFGVLGGVETEALPEESPICGMISVPGSGLSGCSSPYDYSVRGVGADPRDFFSRALSAEYYLHFARWHNRRGESEKAAEYVELATGLARGDAQTYVDAARVYMDMHRLSDAERLLREAIVAEPTYFFAHFALANLYQSDGRMVEAVEEYEKALRGNPQPVPTHVNLGNIFLTEGRYSEAGEHFRKALSLDGSNQMALLGMASVLEATGRTRESMQYIDRAISADPRKASGFHAKASLLMRSGQYQEAHDTLREGLRASPEDPVLLSDMGLYFLRSDRPDSAAAYLERALDLRPDLLAARGNLAVAYERQGLTREAVEQYRRYVEQAPPGQSRERAERSIMEILGEAPEE